MNRVTMGNIGALVSSFFVGSCCLGPTMFVLFGISVGGLNFFTSLERFRPLFILVAFLFLGYAFFLAGLSTPVWSVDQTIQVKVDGMNCDMCLPAVSKALKAVEGVKSAEVSLKDGKVVVVAGEGVKTEDLIKAVEASGHYK